MALRSVMAILLLPVLGACATMTVESSPPDAEVAVILPGEELPTVIGRTPFKTDFSDLPEAINEGAVTFIVRKRGYLSQHFVAPNVPNTELAINTTLLPDLPRNFEEVNRVVALVLKGQRFLLQQRHEEALKVAAELRSLSDNIASAYEIEGSAFFLTNKLREARYAWMRVLELEPDNHEAKGMLSLVESRMGISKPSPRSDKKAQAPQSTPKEEKKP